MSDAFLVGGEMTRDGCCGTLDGFSSLDDNAPPADRRICCLTKIPDYGLGVCRPSLHTQRALMRKKIALFYFGVGDEKLCLAI